MRLRMELMQSRKILLLKKLLQPTKVALVLQAVRNVKRLQRPVHLSQKLHAKLLTFTFADLRT